MSIYKEYDNLILKMNIPKSICLGPYYILGINPTLFVIFCETKDYLYLFQETEIVSIFIPSGLDIWVN